MQDKVTAEGHRVSRTGQDFSGSAVGGQPIRLPPKEPLDMKIKRRVHKNITSQEFTSETSS